MKVLVIEDNKRVAQFVLTGLRESGHTVDHADNGRDGMFMASKRALRRDLCSTACCRAASRG
jgi:DNA-binding response OmpR family regulator